MPTSPGGMAPRRREVKTGSLASQLGFGYSNSKRARARKSSMTVPSSHRSNYFMASVLESSVRADMEERDARLCARKEKIDRIHRISTLYNSNRTSKTVRARARKSIKRQHLGPTWAHYETAHVAETDGEAVSVPRACTVGRPQSATRCMSSPNQPAWRLGCWQHHGDSLVSNADTSGSVPRPKSAQPRGRRGAVLIQTAGGFLPHYMLPKQSGINLRGAASLRNRPARPQSTRSARPVVAGKAKKREGTCLIELEQVTALAQKGPTRAEALARWEGPLREQKRRQAMREHVAEALVGLPRLRVISSAHLRKHLDPESTLDGGIERAAFINAVRSSGLTNQRNLVSRVFSSFDTEDRNEISVGAFLEFYASLREQAQSRMSIAPSVLIVDA